MIPPFGVRVAVIDDDQDYAASLVEYLGARGCTAVAFCTAESFLHPTDPTPPFDFHVVDLMLPGMDGVDLLALIRARGGKGIIVVSGRVGPDSYNSALAAGADIYLTKPIRFDQIIFSLHALQRRLASDAPAPAGVNWVLSAEDSTLLTPGGASVHLTPQELIFVTVLAQGEGATLSRDAIVQRLGIDPGPDYRNLTAIVYRIRRKLETQARLPAPFKTVHGVGYAMSEAIAVRGPAATTESA